MNKVKHLRDMEKITNMQVMEMKAVLDNPEASDTLKDLIRRRIKKLKQFLNGKGKEECNGS